MQYLVWIRIHVQLLLRKLTVGPAAAAVSFSAQSVVFQIQFFLFSDSWEGAAQDIRMQSYDNKSVHPFSRAHGTAHPSYSPTVGLPVLQGK